MTAALIAKLEGASEGSRELDYAVFMATAPMEVFSQWSPADPLTRFTTSIDAALALAERVLPGWVWEVRADQNGATVGCAPAWWNEGLEPVDCGGFLADAASPALAICAALLRASAAEGAGHD